MPEKQHHSCCCCSDNTLQVPQTKWMVTRRQFVAGAGVATLGTWLLPSRPLELFAQTSPLATFTPGVLPLKVQPVFVYETPERREATSWRNWGGIHSEDQAANEKARIQEELRSLAAQADFKMEMLPLIVVKTKGEATQAAAGNHDVLIMYAAGGGTDVIEALTAPTKWTLMFLRHRSGPVYLWYEIAHPRYLRKTVDEFDQSGVNTHDIVTDNPLELLWRLRSLHGLKNTLGKTIVAIGGAAGWGDGGQKAPEIARSQWKMKLVDYPYSDLSKRIQSARNNNSLLNECQTAAESYLKDAVVRLETTKEFFVNSFILTSVFKEVMAEFKTDAITINSCMGTIMPMSKTTACMPLSLLNDAGYLAFCESDFVVIPSGILLHYISGKPVFLNDPTYPHDDVVTLAHCTAPRKMDGRNLEPARILTHFESDYGAAPKVEMKIGQEVTNLVPDFASRKWVGFSGTIVGNPFMDICRSQIDIQIHGSTETLLEEMKGFHWMMSYGNYLRETGYALRKIGVNWLDLTPPKTA
jgi:hypothetical protein